MKKIPMSEIDFTIECHPEDDSPVGNVSASGDAGYDREIENQVMKDLESGNEWAWCRAVVRGEWKGLAAEEHLGGCSYKSEEDFKSGGYYEDMCEEVRAEIQRQAENIVEAL